MVKNSEKGVSLIMTFFIMVIILGIDLSMSAILYSELKIMRNMGNSVLAFFAADSGVEKVLYYDRKVLPDLGGGVYALRGICSMCSVSNPDACVPDPGGNSGDTSVYCNNCNITPLDVGLMGCDWDVCDNCQVTFQTEIDSIKHYDIKATITPDPLLLNIYSTGYYKQDILRAINAIMPEQ